MIWLGLAKLQDAETTFEDPWPSETRLGSPY